MARAKTPAEILSRIPLFAAFTDFTPTVPKLYWDVYSQEERIKAIVEALDKLVCYANHMGVQINLCEEEIEKLYNEFEDFKNGAFDDYYVAILEAWINTHMEDIIKQSIKMIFFGLTDDGYFCAYIPESWSDLTFDTGYDYGWYDYGRLKIIFEPDGFGVIDNLGTNIGMYEELKAKIEDLEEHGGGGGDYDELKAMIETETSDRVAADDELQTQIDFTEADILLETRLREEADQAINERIDALDPQSIEELEARMSTAEEDIEALEVADATINERIDNIVVPDITQLEEDVEALQEADVAINERIDNIVIPDITELEGDISDLQAADVAINERIDNIVVPDISQLEADVATNKTNITNLTSRMTTAEADIDAVETTSATNTSNIATNTADIAALTTRVSTAEGKISAAETDIDTLEASVDTINTTLYTPMSEGGE